jgi:hypothetical protein
LDDGNSLAYKTKSGWRRGVACQSEEVELFGGVRLESSDDGAALVASCTYNENVFERHIRRKLCV